MALSGWDDSRMVSANAGTFIIEMGLADHTYIQGDTAATAAESATHSVPTRLKQLLGGWNFGHDAASAGVLVQGCITSQQRVDSTYADYADYTMDETLCGYNTWILFGGFDVTQATQRWSCGNAYPLRIEAGCYSGAASDSQNVATKLTHVVGGMLIGHDNAAGVPIPGSVNANGTVDFTLCDASGGPFVYFLAGW